MAAHSSNIASTSYLIIDAPHGHEAQRTIRALFKGLQLRSFLPHLHQIMLTSNRHRISYDLSLLESKVYSRRCERVLRISSDFTVPMQYSFLYELVASSRSGIEGVNLGRPV